MQYPRKPVSRETASVEIVLVMDGKVGGKLMPVSLGYVPADPWDLFPDGSVPLPFAAQAGLGPALTHSLPASDVW